MNSFLLIGQSNMAGRGRLEDVEPLVNEEVFMFRDGSWQAAREPLHTDRPKLAGIGLGMSFGDELQKKYGKKIGLIPCAVGGTYLDDWQKDGELYSKTVNIVIQAVQESKLKGILWHQGEADSQDPEKANSYRDRFEIMMTSLIKDIHAEGLPVIVGGLGEFLQIHDHRCDYWAVVNEQLRGVIEDNRQFAFVSSESLTDNGDNLHFDAESLREFGKRYAKAWDECSRELNISLE